MKIQLLSVILSSVIVLCGCNINEKKGSETLSNVAVRTSSKPAATFPAGSKYAFVTFASDSEQTEPDAIDQRIQSSLSAELKKKGYKPANSSDVTFFVAYTLALQQQFDVLIAKSQVQGNEWIAGLVVPDDYVSGALLVQVIDAKSMEPVWIGVFNADVAITQVSEKEKQERVGFAVKQLLKSFPPQ